MNGIHANRFCRASELCQAALAGALLLATVATASAATNLIVNGSFSESVTRCEAGTTVVSGWTVAAGNVDIMAGSCGGIVAPNGQSFFVDLTGSHAENGEDDVGILSQVVPTVVGQAYTLTFAFGANAEWHEFAGVYPNDSTLKAMVVYIDGAISGVYSAQTAQVAATNGQWSRRTIYFTATNASTTISFASLNGSATALSDYGPLLSDVALFTR